MPPPDSLPLFSTSPKQTKRSPFSRWRFYCSAALFGAIVYVVLSQLSYGFARPPPSAAQIGLLTDPRLPTRPHPDQLPPLRPSEEDRTPSDTSDDSYDAPSRLFNYHHLEMDELQEMVGRTKGFFARDYSLWLGWNNMRYIIDAAFLNAKLLNRTLVLPSFVYARACEYEPAVCGDYADMVNKGDAMNSDQWRELPPEEQLGWRIPISLMLNITRMREAHPVILVSDYLRLQGLPTQLETGDGHWDREAYHSGTPHPSLFVVKTEWYDEHDIVRVDRLPVDMKARGGWMVGDVVGDRGTRARWADATESETSDHLNKCKNHWGAAQWDCVLRVLERDGVADISTVQSVEAALNHEGWEVVHTFEAIRGGDMAKAVVEPLLQAASRSSLRPWADDYNFVDDDVLLLEGEVHNGRKPGSMLFTTAAAAEEYQRLVLEELVPVDALQDLARTLATRMGEHTQNRLWMGAHMRRGDFVAEGWTTDTSPEAHLNKVKSYLSTGRKLLEHINEVHTYSVPDAAPNPALVVQEPPREGDPFYVATDERDPDALRIFRDGGALLLDDLLTMADRRTVGWPLMLTDVRAIVEQELLARSALFAGSALSSVSGGILNMRAVHGADSRTALFY